MPADPFENISFFNETEDTDHQEEDNITSVGTSTEWTDFRNNLAQCMLDD